MLLCSALAAGLMATAGPAATKTDLTVYNQGFALVKEQRSFNLKQGLQSLAVEDVAEQIEANSVGIRSLTAPGSFTVLEQNYQYDLISTNSILNKAVGQKIAFNRVLPDGKKERLVGRLMSSPYAVVSDANGFGGSTYNGMVVQLDNGAVLLNPTGEIEVSSLPQGLISKPTLMWELESSRAGKNDVELSYLTQGISWKADYVLSLDKGGLVGDLKGWVTMTNNSGATYTNAGLKLLAGDVQRIQPPREERFYDAAPMVLGAELAKKPFVEEQFSEYHLYTLQRPATVRNREIKQLSLLEAFRVPVTKKLVVDSMAGYTSYYPNEGVVGSGVIKPTVQVVMVNDEKSHMGMPLPMGTVKVFQRDSTGSLQMLGEDTIQHTPKNEKLTFTVGKAFDVVAERKRTDFRWLDPNGRRGTIQTFEIELRNRKETSETVNVIERNWWESRIYDNNLPFEKLDANTVEFVVELKPNEVRKVVYTVETKW